MIECDQDIQRAVEQALRLQASGSWRTLEVLGSQAKGMDPSPADALLSALCVNPLQDPEMGRGSLTALAAMAPRSACALGLSRSLLALAQEQILSDKRAKAETTLRQALACSVEAAAAVGLPIPADLLDQLFDPANVLVQTLASQLDLELARQREQLPAQLVLVLGMHRSGTSALSGLLVESGLDGPADLMPANSNNPKGFFESLGAMHLNDRLLADLGSSWFSTDAIPKSRWVNSEPAVKGWRAGMLKLLYNAYPRSARAVLKDPRLCVLLPALRPWLESNLMPCVVFLTIRHPAEVAESLSVGENIQSISRRQGLILWLRHILESEHLSRRVQRLIVPYQLLIADPEAMLSRCHEILAKSSQSGGLKPLDIKPNPTFIDPNLHRQHAPAALPCWVQKDEAEALYRFALQVFSIITDKELLEHDLQNNMDRMWVQWGALAAHYQVDNPQIPRV